MCCQLYNSKKGFFYLISWNLRTYEWWTIQNILLYFYPICIFCVYVCIYGIWQNIEISIIIFKYRKWNIKKKGQESIVKGEQILDKNWLSTPSFEYQDISRKELNRWCYDYFYISPHFRNSADLPSTFPPLFFCTCSWRATKDKIYQLNVLSWFLFS